MTLRLGGDGAITGCTSLENPDLTVSGLTISGSFDAEKVLVASGTAAAPSYTFSGDTDNGLYCIGWVKDQVGPEKVLDYESQITENLNEQQQPTHESGVPWETSVVTLE